MQRRRFVQGLGMVSAMLLMPAYSLAAAIASLWNKQAFESKDLEGAMQGMQFPLETPVGDIQITAPDRAENGAVVQVEVTSRIPNTESIAILVSKNPTPLIANFLFSNGAQPFVVTRIKMAETDDVQAIIKAGDQYFKASKRVEVLADGCN